MRTISNVEITRRLLLDEKIASKFTFNEILYIVDMCRTIDEELSLCDAEKIIDDFRFGFLERIYWEEYENQTK